MFDTARVFAAGYGIVGTGVVDLFLAPMTAFEGLKYAITSSRTYECPVSGQLLDCQQSVEISILAEHRLDYLGTMVVDERVAEAVVKRSITVATGGHCQTRAWSRIEIVDGRLFTAGGYLRQLPAAPKRLRSGKPSRSRRAHQNERQRAEMLAALDLAEIVAEHNRRAQAHNDALALQLQLPGVLDQPLAPAAQEG
jgi:hypothetical protein